MKREKRKALRRGQATGRVPGQRKVEQSPSVSGKEILTRYRRVKGTGTFFLEDFAAITGCPVLEAVKILERAEKDGEVLYLGDEYYLLKPQKVKVKNRYDWFYKEDKMEYLWSLIPKNKFISRKEIVAKTGWKNTLLTMYLWGLEGSGYIERKKVKTELRFRRIKNELGKLLSWRKIQANKNLKRRENG